MGDFSLTIFTEIYFKILEKGLNYYFLREYMHEKFIHAASYILLKAL